MYRLKVCTLGVCVCVCGCVSVCACVCVRACVRARVCVGTSRYVYKALCAF